MEQMLANKTFDEIQVGGSATATGALGKDDIETWAAVTANPNVMPLKEAAAGEENSSKPPVLACGVRL